jgi:DNA polymerase-3 subunit epsilon
MSPKAVDLATASKLPLAIVAVLLAVGAIVWADLDTLQRATLAALFSSARLEMIALLLSTALILLGWHLFRLTTSTRDAALRIAESIRLIANSNPAHRVALQGPAELCAIVQAANDLAAVRAGLMADVQAAVNQAKAGVEEEKNRFAALISELDQSVLVCNRDGRILLYNAAVTALLDPQGKNGSVQSLGLGRSAFTIIDRSLILHAVEAIEGQGERGERESVQFVTASPDGRLLRVNVAPVFGDSSSFPSDGAQAPRAGRTMTGFVLLLADVTEHIDSDARSVTLFQDLVEGTRAAIASIRAAVEMLIEHPDLDPQRRARFTTIVQSEAVRLSERLDTLSADVSARLRQRWPLEEMRGVDLLALAARRITRRKGLRAEHDSVDPNLWLRVDSFTLVQAVSSLAGRLQEEFAVRDVKFRLQAVEKHAQLDLAWKGVPMSSETAFNWQNDSFTLGGEDSPLSLAQVMERHGGEAWYQRDAPSQTNYFRLLLPLASEHAAARARPWQPNRPEFYDFDLFGNSAATDAFDSQRLIDLAYTVFDTETTGLDPNQGDEIISIGAARIVNGRLLKSETFEALVNPQRGISAASIEVHGITPDLLAGQPLIGQVLPRFWRFAEDTVLVGHNAAFDMRFLQLKEAQTGVQFRQPVLDTLLLGAVVNPSEPSQSLEAIAGRLGINIIGRHTALGDALATAEVFLGLIPLLAAQGVHTLGEARAASQKTFYARLKY